MADISELGRQTSSDAPDPIFPVPSRLLDGKLPRPYVSSKEQYLQLYNESIRDPDGFWSKMATDLLDWMEPFQFVRNGTPEAGDFSWFHGGKLNVSYNCIDRHALKNPEKTAIIWEADEPGQAIHISYGELLAQVCKLANVFKSYGLKKGDYVAIYMPMVPEAVYAMLACARLGLVHCVIFAGFSSDAIRDRIQDCGAKCVLTADQGKRGGKNIGLKKTVDAALQECPTIEKCIVLRRTGEFGIPMHTPRDVWYHEEVEKQRPYCEPEAIGSEDPLFNLYTSGSTGKPKGLIHISAGYLLQAAVSFKYIFDYHENDKYFCTADVGWITGHSYIVYGPLCMGATTLVFESVPTYPDAGRFWQVVEQHKITQLYTAPTAIRTLRKAGDSWVTKYDRSSLRVLGSVGEPINPEAWLWYYEVCGNKQCSIVDTYWQTETGSIIMTPLPGAIPTKPGSCTVPFFGVEPELIDVTTSKPLKGNDQTGVLCVKISKGAWPSLARTVLNNHGRYLETYFKPYPGYYFTGDGATRDKDGYYWIRGRVDDVINVSGHRISTSEVESTLIQHPACAEAAGVGINDEVTGQAIAVFVVPKTQVQGSKLAKELITHVRSTLGPFAAPKKVFIVPDLPKTRSGKIMRRILRKIAGGDVKEESQMGELGDLSTLSDPGLIPQLIQLVHKPGGKL